MTARRYTRPDVLDLFAGVGGWDLPLVDLGFTPLGLDIDRGVMATRQAAGLRTLNEDVAAGYPGDYAFVDVVVGSPPCPALSQSNRRGEVGLDTPGGRLVYEPLRYIEVIRPRFVALEQVTAALPVWRETAARLEEVGYATVTGEVNAADYGVGQARRRAVLLASREVATLTLPDPTHAAGGEDLFGRRPWVTMAEALEGLGPFDLRHTETGPYLTSDRLHPWCYERPATTVTSAGRVPAPGYRQHDQRQFGAGTVRLTLEQAARLQSFPDAYPWRPPAAHRQIGNAIPPLLAQALLEHLVK